MGAGILPTCVINGKIYFLFGKENKHADTPGWSDFGGGQDDDETPLQTAVREGGEELTGFLGSDKVLASMLRKGTVKIMNENAYCVHLFHYPYDDRLPFYYNNNQRFLQTHLDENVIKTTKIFEKAEIRWFCEDELPAMAKHFRSYYLPILKSISDKRPQIMKMLSKSKRGVDATRKRR